MLAAYYGSQQTDSFMEEYGYRLSADSAEDGNTLLSRYYQLEEGVFPASSSDVHEYSFSFVVGGLKEPSFKLKWLDYPGGWWEREPSDAGEKAERDAAIRSLLASHAVILLLDGERYVKEGQAYVKKALDQFRNEGEKIKRASLEEDQGDSWPRNWIIAISKADLLPAAATAESVSIELLKGSLDSINGIDRLFGDDSYGVRVLLLSSVKARKSKIVDAHCHIGFPMLAPAVLLSSLEEVRNRAPEGKLAGVGGMTLTGLRKMVGLVDRLDDFLPEKYQFITIILQAIELDTILKTGAEVFRKRQEKAVRRKQFQLAGIEALKAQMASEEGRKVYFQP